MTELVKAKLCEVGTDNKEKADTKVDVQFNPTSLRVAFSNKSAGGQQGGSQTRQKPGTGEIQVSFDLIFDTADEEPLVPVTKKTMIVEKFVRPPANATPKKQAPPRVQFEWGSFKVQGVMESANVDLDLFAADGTPLRAKVAVSIKGQDPDWSYAPATNASGAATPNAPGPRDLPSGAPGTQGASDLPSKVVPAMPGESLQQLAARNGLDPSAWRALAQDIANPLSLPAGLELALPTTLVAGSGVTGSAGGGFDAERVAASVPLVSAGSLPAAGGATAVPATATSDTPVDRVRTGQAVAQQGGVAGAIARARGKAQRGAVDAARGGFGMPPRPAAAPVDDDGRRPYGSGVPLRPPRGDAHGPAPVTSNVTIPSWEALPARGTKRVRTFDKRRPVDSCLCDCSGGRSTRRR